MISGQVLDNETLVSQVVGVFAKQTVEGAFATVFFLIISVFYGRKVGMENVF